MTTTTTAARIARIDRAENWTLTDPCTGTVFFVQFWDMNEEDSWGKRRMSVAIWMRPSDGTEFKLALRTRHFFPAPSISCDGSEAARHAISFLDLEDVSSDELEETAA